MELRASRLGKHVLHCLSHASSPCTNYFKKIFIGLKTKLSSIYSKRD
jgi:hypothetical protein